MAQVYISFFEATELLKSTLGDSPSKEEFWMWCFEGKKLGGLDAYLLEAEEYSIVHCGGLSFPTRQSESDFGKNIYCLDDLTRSLKFWHFLREDIDKFVPQHRYITGWQLLTRWTKMLEKGEPAAKEYIKDYSGASTAPCLTNYCPAAESEWENGLGGIYLLDDVHAIEDYCKMEASEHGTMKDAQRKTKNQQRDDSFNDWVAEKNIDLDSMKRAEIHEHLKGRNLDLWKRGFNDWWKKQKYHKKKPGRPAR
ncbi:MAG: hypothetical protein M8364_15945 [Methylobacter sp.]|uniref:hypothetical protein n=1 Tax=Methylobacter sp. TaxID=2051955 RepID=UPI002584C660|nr:hypothetical protein [Methylobacter sp.]MCL7422384.1 hypothetical protein [Methylobacter sp.]